MRNIFLSFLLILLLAPLGLAQTTDVISRVSFEPFLSTSNEVPPVTGINAGGTAIVSFLVTSEAVPADQCVDDDADGVDDNTDTLCECVDDDGDGEDDNSGVECSEGDFPDPGSVGTVSLASVDFLVNYSFGADEMVTGMHIHRGVRGENGPVVINSGLSGPMMVAAGSGTFTRSVSLSAPADLAIVNEILANPTGFYLNVHTESSRSGLMRGQLRAEASTPPPSGGGPTTPPPSAPGDLTEILNTIQATLNQIRVENQAQRDTTNRIAARLGVLPVDPTEVDPDDIEPVEDCVDEDGDEVGDETGGPCLIDEDDQ